MGEKTEPTILVVDDDPAMRDVLEMRLSDWGFQVVLAQNAREAEIQARRHEPELVLTDVVMPDGSGVDLLRKLRSDDPTRPVILLTAHGTVEMAVEAMKSGATDFLTKPLDHGHVKSVIDEVLAGGHPARERELSVEPEPEEEERGFARFVGESPAMVEVYDLIREISRTDVSVLITGESGTGKELAARTIHELSRRESGAFVALNSAAIPRDLLESELFGHEKGAFTGATRSRPGCFELADGGTLFLDEIAEMPTELQPKLLRVLDESRFRRLGGTEELDFDVRTLAATNQDPRAAVRDGSLREDLYFRLDVVTLALPALRERAGDVPLLARTYLRRFTRKHGTPARELAPGALELLERYTWPGNVRELRNVMERAVILASGDRIEPAHLPPYVRRPDEEPLQELVIPPGLTADEVEKRLILQTLNRTGNNKAEAARRLGVNVKTIRNKLNAWGIDR